MDAHQEANPTDDPSSYQVEYNDIVSPITCTYLSQLNDDCLLEIFSNNCLTTLDLCSLAETCTRFKGITQGAFPREFKIIVGSKCGYNNTREYKFQSKNYSSSHKSVNDIVRILTNFGSHLSALTMHGNDPTVTDVISKYCDDGSLKRMEVFAMEIIEDVGVKFKKILDQLEVLYFKGSHKDQRLSGTTLQLNCDSLLELEIMSVDSCSAILSNTFPNLERFSFQQYHIEETDMALEFIGRHKSLRALEWYTAFSTIFRNNFARAIDNCCEELEKLTLRSFHRNNIINLSELRSLTKLTMLDVEILNENHQLSELLPTLKSLEILKMSNMVVEADVMDSLTELKHMRELHLIGCSSNFDLWPVLPLTMLRLIDYSLFKSEFRDIIVKLPNLEELEIYSWEMSEKLYRRIREIANQRPNELKLKCRFAPRRDFGIMLI